ncbi:MAG: monophosphatase [Acidimicrobiaceae bacterium]|nr:monophosphatase [Acidimicrobiaceae bacterium]
MRRALDVLGDWGPAPDAVHPGQYVSDQAADAAVVDVLLGAGLGVLSEESGLHHAERDILVVVDPVDGSTNASRGIPWFATSLCALDRDSARAAVVVNQATGTRFEAVRGGGARCDGVLVSPSSQTSLADAVVALSGYPAVDLGWRQFRAFGAAALDLCAVAAGLIDAYVDCMVDALGPWDYLGGMLICEEAGAHVVDAMGRSLVCRLHDDRRTPVAAATPALLEELLAARRKMS